MSTETAKFAHKSPRSSSEKSHVIVRFAGDSGDGIQLTGTQFTNESALAGNDLATLPNFPAEIRAPAGTLAGVSGFQIHFGSQEIYTPGDTPDVLIALNPAALKQNLRDLVPGGILLLNEDAFTEKNLKQVGYLSNPIEDAALREKYRVYVVPISKLTKEALTDTGLSAREIERCKNYFVLGLVLWMFNRPTQSTLAWINEKFAKKPELIEANTRALKAGIAYAEATEVFDVNFVLPPAKLPPGTYRNISGNTAMAYGFVAAAQKSENPLFWGAYPITPASELLHELARHKRFGITTFQAEDEIAAICSAIGASYAGALGVTCSSGPGISLKIEAMALAIMAELPLVIVNVQRGGPSTGLPTKTEQADLMQALYGRAGEAPLCVLAASSPNTAFTMAFEACRIAIKYMTPVMLLSDGYINTTSEPWKLPDPSKLPSIKPQFAQQSNNPDGAFLPYMRDSVTLARPWAKPGTPGLTHRIGGIEKENLTGNVCYEPENHQLMSRLRAEKIERISAEIPPTKIDGPESGELLVVGWGSTEGSILEAVRQVRAEGKQVSRIHLHYLNPLPPDLAKILGNFGRILVPEINFGQLRTILRDRYLVDAQGFNRLLGLPLKSHEIKEAILQHLQTH